ncbi:MAG TPA: multifunctional oxoglutarate decarboxylase/oxoglutarate dehydrogenase thiamine pyrophosphate-binding subunit/dihydrolipoyllysine-residue succinyltransferase subunit [Solirubrobacteraceae bacterium]|jgi:2-oxoglutarate dehydrogenase E1 component|nr:multifunctional oxoglutarate decarboxylase/oxoglutarate dehydrogenase thiamine pyrophosphate-binding subunit/dihydrolipoyllysine-residue succinyltransferase subunit [Solirubrobacteraceae bacterium]
MASGTTINQMIDVVTPAAGESVTEGTILEWHVKVGDFIKVDDTIVEISTDKVDVELPSPASGTVVEILAEEGDTVGVGQVIARLAAGDGGSAQQSSGDGASSAEDGNGAAAPRAASSTQASAASAQADTSASGAAQAIGDGATTLPDGKRVSPVAARVAATEGIDLAGIPGSGPGGRIVKADVLGVVANGGPTTTNGKSTAAAEPAGERRLLKGSAAMLARYMDESRSIPTATSFRTLTVTALDGRRRELKGAGRKVSFTHLIAYAIVQATQEMPSMVHHFAEIEGKPYRIDDGAVNLGLAVDVEKKDGSRTLMVPVIRGADRLSFEEFLGAYDALVEKARTNTLTADDLTGANITLTNPGGLGTIASVPRLMNGQGTIVATGSIAYPVGLGNIGEQIGAEKVMTMTSTYDHRVIQGAESGRFLGLIEQRLHGEHDFYERVFASLGVELGPAPAAPAPTGLAPAGAPTGVGGVSIQASAPDEQMLQAVQAASTLLHRFRSHGHLAARLDPLGSEPEGEPQLDPETAGLTPQVMAQIPARILRMYVPGETLAEALPNLRQTYCGTIAYEIEHISSHRQRVWLREQIESGTFRQPLGIEQRKALLKRLIEVDALERFMHKAYLGQHQFSIEGLDMTVPMLDELIQLAAGIGGQEVVVGMAHRGRLNVLAHNLGRPYDTIFAEFEGASTLEAVTTIPQGGTGDVKYHHGSQGSYKLPDGGTIRVNLESNPSHLEYVSPVVEGATRAAQTTRTGPRAHQDTNAAVPIVIHGDAAFPAQGVVAETLNLQALDGYQVGGTVHLIMNNQVGFTTDPDDARSTRWASDLAKGFDVPIIHVNADDVPACMSAVRLAFAFRQEFGHDVLIDLIGYRRFGHNESDEPAYTQPEMYAKIKTKKRVYELWAEQLIEDGVVSREDVERTGQEVWDNLTILHQRLKAKIAAAAEHGNVNQSTGEYQLDRSPSPEVDTAVPAARVRELGLELLHTPEDFTVHPKLVKQLERRRAALVQDDASSDDGVGEANTEKAPARLDWAHAEALAFASLLTEGTPVRLTGQDTERGTFSQRHLVLHDAKTGRAFCPIQSLGEALAPMELHNSPLSELACMGFEYGYSQEAPETLVLWEAQFGDFVNSAQVIVDQFIASGLAKWGQTSRLTLLLPHGYEGSGPEHSSARLERFLALAAEGNMRVANLTTPAQYFHLLRRQALIAKQRPLVIMTPKSLLRLPQATNTVEDLAEGSRFEPVLAEPGILDESAVTRLVLCTGKIYYDLAGHPDRQGNDSVAIGRVELLYPFPERNIRELMGRYPHLKEILWVQEEPRNVGARAHMFPRLMQIMPEDIHFGFVGRPERASPGEGYPAAHIAEQSRIVKTALDLGIPVSQYPKKTPGER